MCDAKECVIEPVVRAPRPRVTSKVFSDQTLGILYQRTWVPEYEHVNTSGAWKKRNSTAGWYLTPLASWSTELGININSDREFIFRGQEMHTLQKSLEILFSGQFWLDQLHQAFTATNPQSTMFAAADVQQAVALGNIAGCGVELAIRLDRVAECCGCRGKELEG
ncbi:hypothetical protein BDW74DRAFT_178018 [Aspergillus multicolor]|uniref:uncharacterized protein n=1 Tax=Aspergillus multicolor TaxID=41759 RepID=UPI003CCDD278